MTAPPATLRPTAFIDSDHPDVVAWAEATTAGATDDIDRAVRLFYAVRDGVRYDPYQALLDPDELRASHTLHQRASYCVPKAILLAAGARALGIGSRLRFADVRNHLTTKRLRALMGSDLFVFHGYTELFLDGRWVKATPTFDRTLCERLRVGVLDFDGRHDSLLHPFDPAGREHMTYVVDRGAFDDLPYDEMVGAWRAAYPTWFGPSGELVLTRPTASFAAEAAAETSDPHR